LGYRGRNLWDGRSWDKWTILRSTDGDTWTTQTSPTTAWLIAVTFAQNRYVAVGDAGTMITSVDGISWRTLVSVPTAQRLNNIAYSKGRWVAVGEAGIILTSGDGETWIAVDSLTPRWLRGLAYIEHRYPSPESTPLWVATGQDGVVLISEDSRVWQQIPSSSPLDPTFDREVILPRPEVSYSTGQLTRAAGIYNFLAVGSGGMLATLRVVSEQSTFEMPRPPRSWLFGSLPVEASIPSDIVWRSAARFADTVVIAGTAGSIGLTDPYGKEFSLIPPLISGDLHGSGFGQGALLVVGDDQTILRSVAIFRSRLTNISTRGRVEQEQRQLIAGAVIVGTAPKELLIRAAGPTLANFGVSGPLAKPRLQLFDSSANLKAENQGLVRRVQFTGRLFRSCDPGKNQPNRSICLPLG